MRLGDVVASAPGAGSDAHQAWPPTDTRQSCSGLSTGAEAERRSLLFLQLLTQVRQGLVAYFALNSQKGKVCPR